MATLKGWRAQGYPKPWLAQARADALSALLLHPGADLAAVERANSRQPRKRSAVPLHELARGDQPPQVTSSYTPESPAPFVRRGGNPSGYPEPPDLSALASISRLRKTSPRAVSIGPRMLS